MEDVLILVDVRKQLHTADGERQLSIQVEVKEGELVALFGPSGCGKTTFLRMLSGLMNPDEGTIRDGSTVWFDSERRIFVPAQERRVGLMFQDYALFPNMNVTRNLQYARPRGGVDRTAELLETFGLSALAGHLPVRLSGGQRQRVALARAIASQPRLLLLDEPLSALDQEMRQSLRGEIAKAHRMFGATTVLVSHDREEITALADRVLVFDNGRLSRSESPSELFRRS